jgi:DNA ligase-1
MKKLASLIESIMNTSSTKAKEDLLVNFLTENPSPEYIRFLGSEILPKPQPLNIGKATVSKAIENISGANMKELVKEHGSVSLATFYAFQKRNTKPSIFDDLLVLPSKKSILTILENISKNQKKDAQGEYLFSIFNGQDPLSAMALSHFILEDLPVGYNDKILIKAIARVKSVPADQIELAYYFTNSFTKLMYLNSVEISSLIEKGAVVGFPVKCMLCETLESTSYPCITQRKLDGNRLQIHIISPSIFKLYSRKLEDVTASHPDLEEAISNFYHDNVSYMPCILDGEAIIGGKFTDGMTRFRRKHDIEEYAEKYPVTLNIFDIIVCSGASIDKMPLSGRIEYLSTFKFNERIQLVPHIITNSEVEMQEYFSICLEEGYEGIIIKDIESQYLFNSRGSEWQKLKPKYTYDLICYDGNYGTNKNKDVMSSIKLKSSEGLELGNCAGISEESMQEITKRIVSGQQFVVEVEFESLQKGDTSSGYSLRFPRFIRIRDDKQLSEANSMKDITKCKRT